MEVDIKLGGYAINADNHIKVPSISISGDTSAHIVQDKKWSLEKPT